MLLVVSLGALLPAGAQSIQKLAVNVNTREVAKGYSTNLRGELFYTSNGNLVTHITYPEQYILVANSKGEVRLYDPQKNAVRLFQNALFSTSSTQLHYFLAGLTDDLGLKNAGYAISDAKFDGDLAIVTWQNTGNSKNPIQTATLVKRRATPIYLDYRDRYGKIIRKVFFYNYTHLNGIPFPQAITEILYDGKDSTVSKTEYADFRLNEAAAGKYFNFKVPLNAKLIQ